MKHTYCKAIVNGPFGKATIYFNDPEEALTSLAYDFEVMEKGEEATIKLKMVELTEKQYEALGEFDGW
jgi:lysophospholipid acyltransferase (LPLAT)-like uncharacterized protein